MTALVPAPDTATTTESAKPENLSSEALVDRVIAKKWTNTLQPVTEEEVQSTADQQPAAEVEPPKLSWRTATLDDIDNEFFKGKPAEELYKSYKASVDQMNKANKKANDSEAATRQLQQQLEQIRQQQQIDQRVQQTVTSLLPAQPPTQPQVDPRDQRIRELWFDDPAEAHRLMEDKFNDRITREREDTLKRAEEIADRKYRDYDAVKEAQYRQTTAQDAASKAAGAAMNLYGWDEVTAAKRVMSTMTFLNIEADSNPQVWLYPENYLKQITEIFGEPPQKVEGSSPSTAAPAPALAPIIITQPAPPAQPPGSTRPSPVTTTPTQTSLISEEQRRAREVVASIVGIDPKGLYAREERRLQERKRKSNA